MLNGWPKKSTSFPNEILSAVDPTKSWRLPVPTGGGVGELPGASAGMNGPDRRAAFPDTKVLRLMIPQLPADNVGPGGPATPGAPGAPGGPAAPPLLRT